jgi:hypothetical protein
VIGINAFFTYLEGIVGARGFSDKQSRSGLVDLVRTHLAETGPAEPKTLAGEIELLNRASGPGRAACQDSFKIDIKHLDPAAFDVPVLIRQNQKTEQKSRRRAARR